MPEILEEVYPRAEYADEVHAENVNVEGVYAGEIYAEE